MSQHMELALERFESIYVGGLLAVATAGPIEALAIRASSASCSACRRVP